MALRFGCEATEMKILKGVCSGDGSAVIGRILFPDDREPLYRGEAVIAIAEGSAALPLREEIVGVIRLSCEDAPPADTCAQIVLPYLPMGCVGKIALLDTAAGSLFVSPDLPTVTRYASVVQGEGKAVGHFERIYTAGYGKIELLPYFKGEMSTVSEAGCIWDISAEGLGEEQLFERYRDAAEVLPPRALTVVSGSRAMRAEEIRAAMRSGVYGNISLLFGGILSEGHLTEALDTLCHAFCELELDGREFNGYLPRGLLVDTPYLLWIAEELRGVDFLVYDLPALARRAISESCAPPFEALEFLCRRVCEVVARRQDLSHRAITDDLLSDECHKILPAGGISEFYCQPDKISRLCRAFEKL